jgi:hypothetical protein
MTQLRLLRNLLLVVVAFVVGCLFVTLWGHSRALAQGGAQGGQGGNGAPPAPPTMADVQHLKDITPPASHPMVDVAFNATNLYFAAQKKNWPLANYFLGETRNRMRWETNLNPGPKGTDGKPVDMKATFDGIDNGSLTQLKMAIMAKDSKAFDDSYKHLLEDCYSCHKAANRPYLRPQIPTEAAQTIINTDPDASWPQ